MTFVRRPLLAVSLVGLGAALLAGCGGSGGAGSSPTRPAAATVSAVACSNPEGGACLNRLAPGTTYRTTAFEPAISYSVADRGWSNLEDLSGNFLLVAPGNDLEGVNAGTSDFIGVYSSIAASRFTDLDGCVSAPVDGVPRTPQGFVGWMQRQRVLAVGSPAPVTISGRKGLVVDVRVAAGRTPTTCTDSGQKVTVALLLEGVAPSSLEHGVIAGMTMRLYLLQDDARLMVVEVDDIDAAPGDLASLSAQVERLRFAS